MNAKNTFEINGFREQFEMEKLHLYFYTLFRI